MHDGHKYLIYEPDNFENRKTMDFINENQEIIKNVFKDAIENSKNRAIKREGYWVIKEEDDELLFDHFINQGFASIITTVDNEKVVKFHISETIDEYEFELHFINGMEKLGYNLYYESFENDFYDDDEYYWEDYYCRDLLNEPEDFVRKKIRDQKRQNKKTKKNNYTQEDNI
jgi:hypothetical protein